MRVRSFLGVRAFGQRRIPNRLGVPLRQNEAIPAFPLRIDRINTHQAEVERGRDVGSGQRSAGVLGPYLGDHLDDVQPHLDRGFLQFFNGNLRRPSTTIISPPTMPMYRPDRR